MFITKFFCRPDYSITHADATLASSRGDCATWLSLPLVPSYDSRSSSGGRNVIPSLISTFSNEGTFFDRGWGIHFRAGASVFSDTGMQAAV